MIELRADVELKDNIMAAMPKITRDGCYTFYCQHLWKKKNDSESTKEVSQSNPFEVLNLVDNDVDLGIMDSVSEVEVVFDKSAKDRSDKGYGTNSLLEQWRDSYPDNDDYDPCNDNMYENHDMSKHLQSICDDLNITARDRRKK
ncbi:hypothetical protein Tco_0287139 [Tanacetum coccineum]